MTVNWKGVYPAVTTQYNEDLSINFDATQTMIDTIIKEGVDGLIHVSDMSWTRKIAHPSEMLKKGVVWIRSPEVIFQDRILEKMLFS